MPASLTLNPYLAFFEGYFQAKLGEPFLVGKVSEKQLDMVKELAFKSQELRIDSSCFSELQKQQLKEEWKQWADLALRGIKNIFEISND